MKIDLTDTTASKINKALVQGRRAIGTPAVGMVLTLVIVTDEENAYDALKAAEDASREHPSRTLVVIKRHSRTHRDRTRSRLDAEVRVGADAGTGETVVLRLHGEVVDHAQSVVLPLLLPDAPVVVWWPVDPPSDPASDPLGALAQRRVTDTYACEQPVRELAERAKTYTPGDTDLSWTRITPWRSMLAAALDQVAVEVRSVEVEGEEFNPSCELLAMWLADRLDVPVKRALSPGPGLTAVRMDTSNGPITLDRADGSLATLSIQGQPDRAVALKRRDTAELLAEELRRLDPDDIYASALRYGVDRLNATAAAVPSSSAASLTPRTGGGEGPASSAAAVASAPPSPAPAPAAPAGRTGTLALPSGASGAGTADPATGSSGAAPAAGAPAAGGTASSALSAALTSQGSPSAPASPSVTTSSADSAAGAGKPSGDTAGTSGPSSSTKGENA
jgi:glucose-6-phosphate dehydrogenase assembly protein OpcA